MERSVAVGGTLVLAVAVIGFLVQRKMVALVATNELSSAAQAADMDPSSLERVKELLREGANPNGKPGKSSPAILESDFRGGSKMAKLLLDAGANVNAADVGGFTALMLASSQYPNGDVKLLLKHGANPNARWSNGRTPLSFAVGACWEDLCESNDVAIEDLLKAGADPNVGDNNGDAPLHLVPPPKQRLKTGLRFRGKMDKIVELLLKHGADAMKVDSRGITPLGRMQKYVKENPGDEAGKRALRLMVAAAQR